MICSFLDHLSVNFKSSRFSSHKGRKKHTCVPFSNVRRRGHVKFHKSDGLKHSEKSNKSLCYSPKNRQVCSQKNISWKYKEKSAKKNSQEKRFWFFYCFPFHFRFWLFCGIIMQYLIVQLQSSGLDGAFYSVHCVSRPEIRGDFFWPNGSAIFKDIH